MQGDAGSALALHCTHATVLLLLCRFGGDNQGVEWAGEGDEGCVAPSPRGSRGAPIKKAVGSMPTELVVSWEVPHWSPSPEECVKPSSRPT